MFDDRWEIHGRLVVVSAMHIGTGETTTYDHVKGKETAESNGGNPEIALIARDDSRQPIIPATTFKGLLRGIAERLRRDEVSRVFGTIKQEEEVGTIKREEKGTMGRLLPRTVVVPNGVSLPDARQMPYAKEDALDAEGNALGRGIFIAARTSVDAATGAAAKNKLFFSGMVAAGAEFEFKLVLLAKGAIGTGPDKELEGLLATLACLCEPEGLPIGRDGGRVRLRPNKLRITSRRIDAKGELQDKDETGCYWTAEVKKTRLPNHVETFPINLVCDGPFLVNDSSWDSQLEKQRPGVNAEDVPQLVGQKDGAGEPLVLADSVMGALRARARWLWALNLLEAGKDDQELDKVDPSAFGEKREVRQPADITGLSAVEKLFGVSGFKGLLKLIDLKTVGEAKEIDLASVRLDRFSGAPIDNALFKTRAFRGVGIQAHFALVDRGGAASPNDDDRKLAKLLFEQDIEGNGLVLGHGGNKGFGWFKPATKAA